jgi:NADPH2:quinone reductase
VRAIVITRPGGPDVLEMRDDVPVPVAGPGRLLVRVHASAVNRADLHQRAGHYPPPPGWPADIPGLEFAGIVEAVGDGVATHVAGNRVMGLVGGGGYAEYVAVAAAEALPVPAPLTLQEAAAIPEVFLTAHDALVTQAGLAGPADVLIHGVGSGVGTAALQLARARGARIFGTARSAWKLERAGALGLDVAIDASLDDFAAIVLRETAGRGVDIVIDLVGGTYLEGNLKALAPQGRLIVVGLVAGAQATLDMRTLLRKRITIRGTVMRNRSDEEKARVATAFHHDALPLFDDGTLVPVTDTLLPMEQAARAHTLLAENRNFGKVVLHW